MRITSQPDDRADADDGRGDPDQEGGHRGHGRVDLGTDAVPHLLRQGGRLGAAHEDGHHHLVEGRDEGQKRGGHEPGPDERQRDEAEGLPAVGAEVLGGQLERLVEAAEGRRHHDDHEG